MFFNLLSNASEAAGPNGLVALSTLDTPAGICIQCEDSGPGVPPELESAIFEPFVSRRTGGFGLGLAVVRQIVAAHHGAIRVGRADGAARDSACASPPSAPTQRAAMSTVTVLVVDDESHMRRVLEIMLKQLGHRVLSAGDGAQALEVLEREKVDLVLTDLRMPVLDGIGLLAAWRRGRWAFLPS